MSYASVNYLLSCMHSRSHTHTHTHTYAPLTWHKQLTATETMNYDDAFTLELVTEELLDKFNFVAGIVPILTTHITKVNTIPPQYSQTCL